jgi:predicted enzyme related to lactoylglutathione lyase
MTATTEVGLLGRPVWYELVTTDMEAAEKFYSAVVGWTI